MLQRPFSSIFLIFITLLPATAMVAGEFDAAFIQQQLARAQNDPQQRVVIEVALPVAEAFEAILAHMDDYTDEVYALRFDNTGSPDASERGVGSVRFSLMADDQELAQEIILYEPYERFAYFTNVAKSTVELPLDFTVGHYRFRELANGKTEVEVSVVYRPSSRWTALLVRLAFDRALERDFRKAEAYLNSL